MSERKNALLCIAAEWAAPLPPWVDAVEKVLVIIDES
jgi:hypothetical protein